MTLTAEQILKEAELTLQKETVDNKLTMEKRASDALVNEILEQRKKTGLDKKAEVIAIENSNPSTIINPEESKIKSFEKIALDLTGIKGIAGNLGKNFMENKGARNAAIGAVAGGALGAATGKDGEKGSSAVKGALLGGTIASKRSCK